MSNNRFDSEIYCKYIQDIKDNKPLSVSEEKEYLQKIQNGDLRAKEEFVKRHLKFVISVAKEYTNDFLELNDLINEGNIGLMKALDKYDFSVETRFMSYAVWWVKQHITFSISRNAKTIRIPENIQIDIKNNTNTKEVATCIPLIFNDDDDNTLNISDSFIINEESDDKNDLLEGLGKIISSLKKRDKQIIELYFGLNGNEPMNLEDIGEEIGLSKERIRQIKNNVIRKLKHLSRDLIRIKNI